MATRSIPIPLPTTTSPGRDGFIGGHRLVNCFARKRLTRGKPTTQIWAIAGLAQFATLSGASTIRGMIEMDGVGYVVGGPLLYSVSQSGVAALVGPVPGTGPVSMARNRRQPNPELVIVSDGLRFIYTGGAVAALGDADLPPPNGVIVIDGYAIFSIPDGRLFASQIDEAGNIDPLAVAREDTSPDANIAIARRGRDVVVFGQRSVGFWNDVGGDPFPLAPIGSIDGIGCMAAASVVQANQTLYFVASDGTVRKLDGYTAAVVSTDDIAEAIATTTDRANITAFAWTDRGNTFLEFSCADWTYVLNLATGYWHEQRSYGLTRWRAQHYMQLGGRHIVGDYNAGTLYEISPTTYTDAGGTLLTEVVTSVSLVPDGMTLDRIDVETIAGVGLNSPSDHLSDPQMMIAASANDGRTWKIEREAPLGKIGEFEACTSAHQFGSFPKAATLKLSVSAAVQRGIVGLTAEAERIT